MRRLLLSSLLLFLVAMPATVPAREIPSEAQLKLAYLYNFAKFIHWPESRFAGPDAPLVIGLFGGDEFNGSARELEKRQIRNRPIIVRRVKTPAEAKKTHILYIGTLEKKRLVQLLKELERDSVLTVGEDKHFSDRGGVIQFVTRRARLRFLINLDNARSEGIRIDSQLLSLAVQVVEAKP